MQNLKNKKMNKESIEKKITRGISENFAEVFKKSELHKLYGNHKDELFLGVRNNYLNLYYNCDSIAKITCTNDSICCEMDKYYLDGKHYNSKDKEKRHKITPAELNEKYEEIKKNSEDKATPEKKAQSKLVLLNNSNKDSNWFCVDIEYVKQFRDKHEKRKADFNGRFDIIALSIEKPHRVALIELKYGSGAIGGKSGLFKHVEDFNKFCEKDYFESHLKQEIIDIVKSQKDLGVLVPFELPKRSNIAVKPEFFFITLDNNPEAEKASTPKQTMAGILFNDKRWECKRLSTKVSVESKFGDITRKDNKFHATFLFSKETLDNLKIADIIDGNYDEKIIPE